MAGFRVQNEVILLRAETTYNTDPTPSAASHAMFVGNVNFAPEGLRMVDRVGTRASLGKLQRIYAGELKRISFDCEVKGSGTAGTVPEIGAALLACGMDLTTVAVTSNTYQPVSSSHGSCTIYYYEGGRKLHILTGCRGNVSFKLDAGGIMIASFEFVGHWTQPTDASQPSPTYSSVVPRPAIGMSGFSINGVTNITARGWMFGLNNELVYSPSMSATDGFGEIIIAGRDVKGETTVETELDSIIDFDSLMSAGTRFAFASGTLGSTAGHRVQLTTPASSTYFEDTAQGEAEGIRLRTLKMAIDDSTADQEISLIFT